MKEEMIESSDGVMRRYFSKWRGTKWRFPWVRHVYNSTWSFQQQPPDLPLLLTDFPPCRLTFLSAPPPPIGEGLNLDLICPAINKMLSQHWLSSLQKFQWKQCSKNQQTPGGKCEESTKSNLFRVQMDLGLPFLVQRTHSSEMLNHFYSQLIIYWHFQKHNDQSHEAIVWHWWSYLSQWHHRR